MLRSKSLGLVVVVAALGGACSPSTGRTDQHAGGGADGEDAGVPGWSSPDEGEPGAPPGGGGAGSGAGGAAGGSAGGSGADDAGTGSPDAGSGGSNGVDGGSSGSGGNNGADGGSGGSGGSNGVDGGSAGSGGTAGLGGQDAGPISHEEFCSGAGPVVKVPDSRPDTPDEVCTGVIARRLFSRALCTCGGALLDVDGLHGGYLKTHSFDSRDPDPTFVSFGAPVGINQNYVAGSFTDVGGTLEIAGTTVFGGWLAVGGDLFLTDALIPLAYVEVARDAWIAGDVVATYLNIGRDFYRDPDKIPPLLTTVGGTTYEQTFQVDPPCACGPDDLLDIDAIIADGRQNNDNAAVGLDPTLFSDLFIDREVELPCGRFYVESIGGIGSLTIKVTGRTALYVEGDVANLGFLNIELGPDAELDLFIGGNLAQIGYGQFGDLDRPADIRVYVGGDGDILYAGYEAFGANLYAPKSVLFSGGLMDFRGSAFVRELWSVSWTEIGYDRAVLDLGNEDECAPPPADAPPPPPDAGTPPPSDAGTPPPPPQCTDRCDGQCAAGQTCKDNECTGCQADADCCPPLVCRANGTCGALLL